MKPGSIVVIRNCRHKIHPLITKFVKWFPNDDEVSYYTIREISKSSGGLRTLVLLEEGIIAVIRRGDLMLIPELQGEIGIEIEDVIEVQEFFNTNQLVEEIIEEQETIFV